MCLQYPDRITTNRASIRGIPPLWYSHRSIHSPQNKSRTGTRDWKVHHRAQLEKKERVRLQSIPMVASSMYWSEANAKRVPCIVFRFSVISHVLQGRLSWLPFQVYWSVQVKLKSSSVPMQDRYLTQERLLLSWQIINNAKDSAGTIAQVLIGRKYYLIYLAGLSTHTVPGGGRGRTTSLLCSRPKVARSIWASINLLRTDLHIQRGSQRRHCGHWLGEQVSELPTDVRNGMSELGAGYIPDSNIVFDMYIPANPHSRHCRVRVPLNSQSGADLPRQGMTGTGLVGIATLATYLAS